MDNIRTKIDDSVLETYPLELGGWFGGKMTYLWFGINDKCVGTLSGGKLYRLAKVIVKHFEGGM